MEDIDIEEPREVGLFLGCKHELEEVVLPNGTIAKKMTYNMEDFFRSCCTVYKSLMNIPDATVLKRTSTPFEDDEPKRAPARSPNTSGPSLRCPWCRDCFPEKDWHLLDPRRDKKMGVSNCSPLIEKAVDA